MKPVDQLFLVDRDGHGDCLRACVASVLELPSDCVPDFSLFGENWLSALALFCKVDLIVPNEASGYWIAGGLSPRGNDIRHSVVYRDFDLAHDPHPSRAGLTGNVEDGIVVLGLRPNVHEWLRKQQAARSPA